MVLCTALGIAAGTVLSSLILYSWHNQTGSLTSQYPCPRFCTCDYSWITKGVFVNCSHHQLPQVPRDIPKKTVQLDLSYNAICLLPRFCNMELLKLLDVSFNQLGDRGAASLKDNGLENLQELRLAGNKITKIPMGIPPTVSFLDLCHNTITTVSSALICDLPPLTNLFLGKNLLNAIKNEGFCPYFGSLPVLSKTLRYLDLSRNVIRTVHDGAFGCLEALEYLDLSGNFLTVIGFGTFQGLNKMQHLSLCRNSISQISDGAFFEMKNLISLNLADNRLTYVPRDLPPKLELLDISNNGIVVLHEDATLHRIKHIFVGNNPLLCDCHLAWIKNQLVKAALPDNINKCSFPVWVPPDNPKAICDLMPRCARPSSVAGKLINEISDEVFECCQSYVTGLDDPKPICPLCSKRVRHSLRGRIWERLVAEWLRIVNTAFDVCGLTCRGSFSTLVAMFFAVIFQYFRAKRCREMKLLEDLRIAIISEGRSYENPLLIHNLAVTGHQERGSNGECPSLPDDKWVWVSPLDSTRIQVQWSLPAALIDSAVELHYYMFGHRECKVKVKIPAEQNHHILTNLRPKTNYVVCVVPQHCPNAHNPLLLDSCLEVRTLPLSFLHRLMRLLLGGTSCCHRNVGLLLLFLILLGLALMAGHILRQLLAWWKRRTSGKETCREIQRTPCAADVCRNIARTIPKKAENSACVNNRTVNFVCNSVSN